MSKRFVSLDGRFCDGGISQDGFRNCGGSGGGPVRRRRAAGRPNGFGVYTKGDANAPWTRDMHEGSKRKRVEDDLSTTNIHKICITNLHYGVTSNDLQELFSEFGPLKAANVNYDVHGSSLGSANVVFPNQNSAFNAIRQYNNKYFDGRYMRMSLVTDYETINKLATCISNRWNGRGDKNTERSTQSIIDELNEQLDSFVII